MRISSCLLFATLATATVPFVLQAQDSDVQAKARQALEQKIKELQQPPAVPAPATPTTPATAQPTEAAPPAQPAQPAQPVTQPPPPVVMVPAQPAVTNSEAVDKAHEALRQKMMELDAEKAARPAPAPATTAAVAAPAAAAATTGTAPAENKNWDAAIAAAVTQANTESSQSRKMDQQDWAAQTRETQSAPSAAARKQSSQSASQPKAVTDKRVAALPALQGPPSGLSASQDQRLRALNQEYMADRISSEQYHVQRAQIMAQP